MDRSHHWLPKLFNGDIAPMVEQWTENSCVAGSSPAVATKQTPTWTNWKSHFSQKEEFSRFDSECGYQLRPCSLVVKHLSYTQHRRQISERPRFES
jgi:hypothetical protein